MHGLGLFARRPIDKKRLICRYAGDLVEVSRQEEEYVADCGIPGWGIDASHCVEAGKFANHRLVPNARLVIPDAGIYDKYRSRYYLYVETLETILPGEEIFVDYSIKYFTDDKTGKVDRIYWYGLPKLIDLTVMWM